jgi:hypothetical protein
MNSFVSIQVDVTDARFHGLLAWAGKNQDRIADTLLVGYQVVEAGIDAIVAAEVDRRCGPQMRQEIEARARQIASATEAELQATRSALASVNEKSKEMAAAIEARASEAAQRQCAVAAAEVASLMNSMACWERRYAELRDGVDAEIAARCKQHAEQLALVRDAYVSGEVTSLKTELASVREELKSRSAEVRQLKSTNHGKGATGEKIICDILQRTFPRFAIRMTGSDAHSGDLHLQDTTSGDFVLFESKYKERITPADVSKFYRDVDETAMCSALHGGKCVGAVFVSLKTKSIPGKGDVCLELHGGSMPIMFIAYDDESQAMDLFPAQAQVIVGLAFAVARENKDQQFTDVDRLDVVLGEVSSVLALLHRNMQRLSRLRTEHITAVQRALMDMERDDKEVVRIVSDILLKNGYVRQDAGGSGGGGDHTCGVCNKAFKTKAAFTKHVKKCTEGKPSTSNTQL